MHIAPMNIDPDSIKHISKEDQGYEEVIEEYFKEILAEAGPENPNNPSVDPELNQGKLRCITPILQYYIMFVCALICRS